MSGRSQVDQVTDGINYAALGFGTVAVMAPRLFAALYGIKGDGNVLAMTRLWGIRTAVIGAFGMVTRGTSSYRTMLTIGTAMSVGDALIIANAGPDVAARARIMGTATALAFAGAGAFAVSQTS
jgi:hypothetical protein